jgi:hypothetical protein
MTENVHFIDLEQSTPTAQHLAERAPRPFKWCLIFLKDADYDPQSVNERLRELEFSFGHSAFETTVPACETGVFGAVDGEAHLAFFKSVSEVGLDEYAEMSEDGGDD